MKHCAIKMHSVDLFHKIDLPSSVQERRNEGKGEGMVMGMERSHCKPL